MSYQHEDRKLAGQFKHYLELFGFSVFLAHEDIEPSEEWPETILHELRSTDVFLPLLTSRYGQSQYTDQESGIAIDRGVLIIPLKVEIDPYGFLHKYQALTIDTEDVQATCVKILNTIKRHDYLKEKLRDSLIQGFANSYSFEDASLKSDYLLIQSPYSEEEVNEILRIASQNNNIYGSFKARENIELLIEENEDRTSVDLVARFREMAETWKEIVLGDVH
jgi:hypothetical protein